MRTDDLINELSPNPRTEVWSSPTVVLVSAALLSLVVAAAASVWGFGTRDDLLTANHTPMLHVVAVISIAGIALALVRDLSVPGRRPRLPFIAIISPFLAMICLALYELNTSSLHQLVQHDGHASAVTCLSQIALLAAPGFIILTLGVRRLAPTDLRRAGAYVGLLAGAIGVLGFCLHAPDITFTYGALVYSTALLIAALIGSATAPRLLRWA